MGLALANAPYGLCAHGCGEAAVYADPVTQGRVICENHKPQQYVFLPFLGQQTKFFKRRERTVFYGGAGGGGKAEAVTEPIPTPTGWVTMGAIKVGDEVFGPDGIPARVVGATEIMHGRPCYRLTFSDGTQKVVDGGHLWLTKTCAERATDLRRTPEFRAARRSKRASRASGRGIRPHVSAYNSKRGHSYMGPSPGGVRTTMEIARTLRSGRNANHSVEASAPVELPEAALPVPPYTLGAWLGDGTSVHAEITCADQGILDAIEEDGFTIRPRRARLRKGILGLATGLRSLGVRGNKHVPSTYLRSSVSQRLALLQGLMDTDGWCEKDGSCKIALCRQGLFDGVVELLRSLGIVVHVSVGRKSATNGRAGNSSECWTACFVTSLPVFRLGRKSLRQNTRPQARYLRRYIVAADLVPSVPVRCIQVDRPDGLYLSGGQWVTTHNSLCGIMKFGVQLMSEARRIAAGEITTSRAWAIYFRRTTPDLKQSVERSRELMKALDPQAKFNENDLIWNLPSFGDAKFQFSHMEHPRDRYKFKSREFTYIFFDELTEFDEEQWEYLDTRLRTDDPGLNPYLQICAGSNPDGQGLIWVRKRFIEIAEPETVVRVETELRDGRIINYDQIFIPAKLSDNPRLMRQGTYEAALQNKRPEVREAILNGNWYISPGAFLANVWNQAFHVVDDHQVPRGAAIFRSGDYGIRSPSEIGWWYVDRDGGMTAFYWLRVTDHDAYMLADRIHEIEEELGLWDDAKEQSALNNGRNPLDEDCFNRNGTGRSIAKAMQSRGVRWKPSKKYSGSRFNGASEIVMRMSTMIPAADPDDPHNPVTGQRPMLRFMKRCTSPIEHLPVLRSAENDVDDVDTKADDHAWDATMYACLERPLMPAREDERDDDDDGDEYVDDLSRERSRRARRGRLCEGAA